MTSLLRRWLPAALSLPLTLAFPSASPAATPPAVLTYHNDGSRTGANLQETVLNTTTVNPASFGKLFTRPVDDQLYAQLLYVPGVTIPGRGTHNVVYAATVNDTVYAFDADYPALDLPLWKTSFLSPGVAAVNHVDMSLQGACGGSYNDFSGNIGIVGTPVIDPTPWPGAPAGDQGTIYVVGRTVESKKFSQRLHALNLQTGEERPGSPVTIQYSTIAGNKALTFNATIQNQRPGLALVSGRVYVGWASHCDLGDYHGWLMSYDAHTLQQTGVYCTTPTGFRAGIWMGGSPPSFDEQGNLYLSTGNGTVDLQNRGESFVKLTPSGAAMTVASYFTPYNYSQLEGGDIDLGSAGLLLFPGANGRNLAIGAGKQGRLYVVDRDNMGGIQNGSDSQIVQSIDVNLNRKIMGGPVYWQGPSGAKKFYIWAADTTLKAYTYNGSTFNTTPQTSTMTAANPGAMLSLSADGSTAGSGIVWAMCPDTDANQHVVTGVLRAFNAEDLSQELWNSTLNSSRDGIGSYAKFNQPTIANGSVYVPTFSNQILVYGRLSDAPGPPAPDTLAATALSKVKVHLEWTAPSEGNQSGFIVERSTDGTSFSQIMYLGADARSYDDTTVARFTDYTYRIKAFNLTGSAISPVATASTTVGGPEPLISLTGSGQAVAPDSTATTLTNGTAFGQILLGTGGSVSHTFIIQNSGNAPLNLTGSLPVVLDGPGAVDFTVTQPAVTVIPPQGTTSFVLTFTPHSAGARPATVTLANDTLDSSTFRFAITGLSTQQDLLALWHFDEATGSLSTEDATGRGNTGTLSPNTPSFAGAFFDNGVLYPSAFGPNIQPVVTVPDAPDLNPTDGITLACWARWNGLTSGYTQPLLMKNAGGGQYRLYIDEIGLHADFNRIAMLTIAAPTRSVWHHIAATYDGAVARLYIDGVEKTSANATGPLTVTSDPLFIGGQPGTAYHLSGAIDDLRLYGRGLTAAEVQKLAAQKTAVSLVTSIPETRKGDGTTGRFAFSSQQGTNNAVNVNFEIVSGPGQGIYRTDYGMSVIPPMLTISPIERYLTVDVTPLSFSAATGPLDVTLRVLEGDGYAVSKNNTATVHILDTYLNQWRIDQFGTIERANGPDAAIDAAPAGDGLTNLLKYALGLPALTQAQPRMQTVLEQWEDGLHMYVVFKLNPDLPPDLEYTPEWQFEDLSGEWQPASYNYGVDEDGHPLLYAGCPIPLDGQSHAFMRLRVTQK